MKPTNTKTFNNSKLGLPIRINQVKGRMPKDIKPYSYQVNNELFSNLDRRHLFLIIGQSNSVGEGEITQSPTPMPGTAYEANEPPSNLDSYTDEAVYTQAVDPMGNSSKGSAWPAFCIEYYAKTKYKPVILSQGLGGTGLNEGVSPNWGPNSYLLENALRKAEMHLHYLKLKHLRGIIWSQGEADAVSMSSIPSVYYKSIIKTAMQTVIDRCKSRFPLTPFYIIKTGPTRPGDRPSAWRDMQDIQEEICRENDNVFMVFSDTPKFMVNYELQSDAVHYTQQAYNRIGREIAPKIAHWCYPVSYNGKRALTEHLKITSKHRGILDGTTSTTSTYSGRSGSSWDLYVRIAIKVSANTQATIDWGDVLNNRQVYDLTVSGSALSGWNYLELVYNSNTDIYPENPADAIALRFPRGKQIKIEFDTPANVTGIGFNKSELTSIESVNFSLMSITDVRASAQLLDSLPVFESGLTTLIVGGDFATEITNQAPGVHTGNKLSFADIETAVANTKGTLTKLVLGTEITGLVTTSGNAYINDPGSDQTYDLTTYTALQEFHFHMARVVKIITNSSNVLTKLHGWGSSAFRPHLDPSDLVIPNTLQSLRLGSTSAARATTLSGPLLLNTGNGLTYIDIDSCYGSNTTYSILLATRTGYLDTTIDNLYSNRANHPGGAKTLKMAGQNPAATGTYQAPTGFSAGVSDGTPASVQEKLYVLANNYSWTITKT